MATLTLALVRSYSHLSRALFHMLIELTPPCFIFMRDRTDAVQLSRRSHPPSSLTRERVTQTSNLYLTPRSLDTIFHDRAFSYSLSSSLLLFPFSPLFSADYPSSSYFLFYVTFGVSSFNFDGVHNASTFHCNFISTIAFHFVEEQAVPKGTRTREDKCHFPLCYFKD